MQLFGLTGETGDVAGEMPWWGDYSDRTRSRLMVKEAKTKLWSDEMRYFAPSAETHVEVQAVPSKKTQSKESLVVETKKGTFMSILAIAKFLHVNGSVYDGRDERRRLTLPDRKHNLRYQMTTQEPSEHCGTLRSLPRNFSGLWTRRGDGILS